MEEKEENKLSTGVGKSTIIAAIVITALVGGFIYFKNNATNSDTQGTSPAMNEAETSMNIDSTTSMETPSSDTAMMEEGTDAAKMGEISVEGGAYYYKPDRIEVKKGETVKITLTSVDMPHDFVLDEFDVKSDIVTKGKSTTVEFTPDKIGEFEFYCSVGSHRKQGMVGKLIVTE